MTIKKNNGIIIISVRLSVYLFINSYNNNMKTFLFWVHALNFVVLVLFMVYFCIVTMNIVFTFDELPISAIPFYDDSFASYSSSRYSFNWMLFALDALRILPPVVTLYTVIDGLLNGPSTGFLYMIVTVVVTILEWLRLIKHTYNYAECGSFQFCRSYDSITPSEPNYVYSTKVWSDFIFTVLFTIYPFLRGFMLKEFKIQQESKTKYQM